MIPESMIQDAIKQTAALTGWRYRHFHDSRRQVGSRWVGDADAKGWPDTVLARHGELVIAEVKTHNGHLTREQREWLEALTECGVECWVVKPLTLDQFSTRLVYGRRFGLQARGLYWIAKKQ